jgi:hypothetical protein
MRHTPTVVPYVLLSALLSGAVIAAPVPVMNPGFEADFALDGTFPLGPVTAWPAFDPNNLLAINGNFTGVINPSGGDCFNMQDAPEGRNAALLFIQSSVGAGPVGLTQILDAALEANTVYTLTVEVGNIASCAGLPPFDTFGFFDLDGFPGYAVQLLAGGVLVAEDFNTLDGQIPEGEFRTTTVELAVGDAHPMLGQPLEIRLINLNLEDSPEAPGIEVNFDDVRLDASPSASTNCNAADVAETFGTLDVNDIITFVNAFNASDLLADLSPPSGDGVLNVNDVIEFVNAFNAGCP